LEGKKIHPVWSVELDNEFRATGLTKVLKTFERQGERRAHLAAAVAICEAGWGKNLPLRRVKI